MNISKIVSHLIQKLKSCVTTPEPEPQQPIKKPSKAPRTNKSKRKVAAKKVKLDQ